jgi:hypothetical protein
MEISALEPQSDAGLSQTAGARDIVLYEARKEFVPFHQRDKRFACIVTHRRAGKTVACVHELQRAAMSSPLVRPRFAYLAPFMKQAKAVAWDYLRAAVAPLRTAGATVHESELRIDYPGGGQVRLYGADNPDALRGIYLDGIVLDENADMDPRVWSEIIRPALVDRRGWATFIGTPKGRNGFFELWRRAQTEDNWFSMMLKASETGLIPESELALARRDLSEEQYAQEFDARSMLRSSAPTTASSCCAPSWTSASATCPTSRPRWSGPPGISAFATPPRSGLPRPSDARSGSSITTRPRAPTSATMCARSTRGPMSMPGISCHMMFR